MATKRAPRPDRKAVCLWLDLDMLDWIGYTSADLGMGKTQLIRLMLRMAKDNWNGPKPRLQVLHSRILDQED